MNSSRHLRAVRCVERWYRLAAAPALALGLVMGGSALPLPALASGINVVDDRGVRVHLPGPAMRVVSLLPSLTETVCALGACGRLVAVDRWSTWPAQVRHLPRVGGLEGADIETIVALRPDLVVVAPSSRVGERLRGLGLTVVELDAQSLDDVQRLSAVLGKLLGRPGEARRLWAEVQSKVTEARQAMPPGARGQSVYVEVSSTPFAAGEASFIGGLLTSLGVRNVVPASLGPFPQISPEWVVRARPDVIIVGREDAATLASRPGWSALPAVTQGRICAMAPADFEVVVRPGPRLGEAARLLARCFSSLAAARQMP